MPLGDFGSSVNRDASPEELADLVSKLVKEVTYLLNGGLDTLNVNELSADVINAGILNAVLVKIAAINGSYSYTFDSTGIKANNGSVDTLKFDLATGLLTIVSAIIKSQSGYPQLAFNVNSNLMQAFSDADNHVDMTANAGSSPGFIWVVGGEDNAYLNSTSGGPLFASFGDKDITIQPAGDLNLSLNSFGNLTIGPSNATGKNASITYIKNVFSDGMGGVSYSTGTMTFTKGILTGFS